jgi:hypothetical protein
MSKHKLNSTEVSSIIGKEGQKIARKCNEDYDELIRTHLLRLTCDNVRELYYGWFNESKNWRSCSGGLTGFSEFLVFRILYHTLTSMGEQFEKRRRGSKGTDPTFFVSKNYEIRQSVQEKLGNRRKVPDILIKHKGSPSGIIQIKVNVNRNFKEIEGEVETMKSFRKYYPKIKGLFVVYTKDDVSEKKKGKLEEAYHVKVLQGNQEIISDALRKFVLACASEVCSQDG